MTTFFCLIGMAAIVTLLVAYLAKPSDDAA